MKTNQWLSWSLLATALFLMSHLAIAPAIPSLHDFYRISHPDLSLASVEMLVTIPAMMIMVVVVASNLVIRLIGKKRTVELGLGMIVLSGLVSFLAQEFAIVLIGRLLLGVGIGLYNPLTVSLISDYYEGEERARLIGWRTAVMNVGKTLTTFLAGYALLLGTPYIFLVYLLALPVLFLFHRYVPEVTRPETVKQAGKTKLDGGIWLWIAYTFLVGVSYIGATIKIPTLLVTHYGYTDQFSSNILTLLALSGIGFGVFFGHLAKLLQKQILPVLFGLIVVGNLCFVLGNVPLAFIIGAICIGSGFVGGMSAIFHRMSQVYDPSQLTFATSLAITAGNVGVVLTPILLTKLVQMLGWEPFVTPFYIKAFLMALGFLGAFFDRQKK